MEARVSFAVQRRGWLSRAVLAALTSTAVLAAGVATGWDGAADGDVGSAVRGGSLLAAAAILAAALASGPPAPARLVPWLRGLSIVSVAMLLVAALGLLFAPELMVRGAIGTVALVPAAVGAVVLVIVYARASTAPPGPSPADRGEGVVAPTEADAPYLAATASNAWDSPDLGAAPSLEAGRFVFAVPNEHRAVATSLVWTERQQQALEKRLERLTRRR